MDTSGIKFRFVFYRIFSESPIIGVPFLYSSDIDQLRSLIQYYNQYRIILVCKTEHVAELYNIIIERDIDEIFTLGICAELNIEEKKVTIIDTNEQDLRFHILCTAMRYTHHAEIVQRQQGNYGIANLSATDFLKLLNQVELLVKASTEK